MWLKEVFLFVYYYMREIIECLYVVENDLEMGEKFGLILRINCDSLFKVCSTLFRIFYRY